MVNSEAAAHPGLTGAALAAELSRLGIRFVEATVEERPSPAPTPKQLLTALASSDEARLRMALIPLLIARADYARYASDAAHDLDGVARMTLVCYYTAAMLLQRKYAERLARLDLDVTSLPNLFGRELDLLESGSVEAALHVLGKRHADLSGRPLNWYGTYEQAASRFIRRLELESTWAAN